MRRRQSSEADRAVDRVMAWGRFYTAGLPRATRDDRLDEVLSDLHEQRASSENTDRVLSRSIGRRAIRGAFADVAWRRAEVRTLGISRTTITSRLVAALFIIVMAVTSTILFSSSNDHSAAAANANVLVADLKDQVHGEALFVEPLYSSALYDLINLRDDPNYVQVLPQEREAALAEFNNYRSLLAQLEREQRSAKEAATVADHQSLLAVELAGLVVGLLLLFLFVVWFEPRVPRRAD